MSSQEADTPPPPPLIGGTDNLASAAPASYEEFARRTRSGVQSNPVDEARYSALREAALAYAAQAGFARRSWEIMQQLETDSTQLSETFNFNSVVTKTKGEAGIIVPPVVTRATAAISIHDEGRESVAADEYYRIEEPGRIVGIVPTWRDYLVLPMENPQDPSDSFLPADKEERKIWDRYMREGWSQGYAQADEALKLNMNRLKRDYLGMVEFRRLVEAGLITNMVIRTSERRSAGIGNELFIGERRVKIENAAQFVRDPRYWKPVTRRFSPTK